MEKPSYRPYRLPAGGWGFFGCIGGYYPECDVSMPLWHCAIGSKTPAAKMVPVTVHGEDDRVLAPQLEDAAG
ncbi:hypothetical protein [Methylobacterium radiodurans]|uniref:Uncharacterized protein n=1 Tax=Methylobacterium radiodurans TaxID=2202828 RepID=A0A2U8VXG7_9HYPH|nr:hypothetical protein [Methylobacterium radiodurans]AWN38465.1 hypothetical protein DK427_24305 [Methylobacterium radiodurans]